MHICYADIWAIRRDRRTKCADIFVVRSSMVFQYEFLFEFQLDFFVRDAADSIKIVIPKP